MQMRRNSAGLGAEQSETMRAKALNCMKEAVMVDR